MAIPRGKRAGSKNADGRLRRWVDSQIDIAQVCDEDIQDIIITSFPFFFQS